MKVYNPDHNEALLPGLKDALAHFRKLRGFDPAVYADAKADLINQYYSGTPLQTAIVGMSGGIDSSVAAGLLHHARKQPSSPLKDIIAVTIPAYVSSATGQSDAASRAYDVMDSLGLERLSIDISKAHAAITGAVEQSLGVEGDEWARGQSVAHVRTMALAYTASLMQMQKRAGIVIGTTNRDEGAYLGYVGKYSDGMVDLQIISDLHKSEVYQLARYLDLPASTINAIPKGDMYDARADTEVFGAPYDFVELYQNFLMLPKIEQTVMLAGFTSDERVQFNAMAENLERLHGYNGHKYFGNQPGSPAFHVNVLPSGVPGGWTSGAFGQEYPAPANPEKIFNGYFELSPAFLAVARMQSTKQDIAVEERVITAPDDAHPKTARILRPLISAAEAQALITETADKNWQPAALDGYKLQSPDDTIGSWRATTYSPEYAAILWDRIAGTIPLLRRIPEGTDVDAQNAAAGATVWRAVGINPALRFIKYVPGADNLLFPHYDAPPSGDNTPKSLDSLVVYLTDSVAGAGGETGFIVDPQAALPALQRDVGTDWTRVATDDEIITKVAPEQGLAVIFPHRALHSSQPLAANGDEKIIIRSDIIYEPVRMP
jgi:NAD+ synthetase